MAAPARATARQRHVPGSLASGQTRRAVARAGKSDHPDPAAALTEKRAPRAASTSAAGHNGNRAGSAQAPKGQSNGSSSTGTTAATASAVDGTQAPPPAAPAPSAVAVQPSTAHEELPGVTSQLVRVLSPPRPVATGTYTVKVSLHPQSLGVVHATVTAGDARLAVHLTAGTSSGELAIRQSLAELHEALSSGGQQATVTVSGGHTPGSGPGQRHSGAFTATGMHGGAGGGGRQHGAPPRQGTRLLGAADRAGSGVPTGTPRPTRPNGRQPGDRLVDVHV